MSTDQGFARGDAVLGQGDDGASLGAGVVQERGQGVSGSVAAGGERGSSGQKRWRS
ncbi:hypothetical protein SFUMM280S_09761 [Streptomyces fumanus]